MEPLFIETETDRVFECKRPLPPTSPSSIAVTAARRDEKCPSESRQLMSISVD